MMTNKVEDELEYPDLAHALREAMFLRRISTNDLAHRYGCTPGYISSLKTGNGASSIETIWRLAAICGLTVSEFIALGEPAVDDQ